MIVRHIDGGPDLVFLATSPKGTCLYDPVKMVYVVVQGFTTLLGDKCVYDKNTVQIEHSMHGAFYTLWPEERRVVV